MKIIPYVILLYSPFVWYKLNAAPYQVYVDVSAYTYASNNHGHLNGVYTKVEDPSTGEVYYMQYPDDPVTSGSLNKIVDFGTSWRLSDYDGYPIDERFTTSDSPVGAYQSGVTVIVHEENNPDPPPDSNGTGTGDQDNDVPTLLEIKAVLETLDSDDDVPKLTEMNEKLQQILEALQQPPVDFDPVVVQPEGNNSIVPDTQFFTEEASQEANTSIEAVTETYFSNLSELHDNNKEMLSDALGLSELKNLQAIQANGALPVYDVGLSIADTPIKIDLSNPSYSNYISLAKIVITGAFLLFLGYYTFVLFNIILAS